MRLDELHAAVVEATTKMNEQDAYVKSLGEKITAGETTIKVFADDVWTTVKLLDFWQIQYDKYIAMSGYAGDLSGLETSLQKLLDDSLANIPLPDARVKAIEAAKADAAK